MDIRQSGLTSFDQKTHAESCVFTDNRSFHKNSPIFIEYYVPFQVARSALRLREVLDIPIIRKITQLLMSTILNFNYKILDRNAWAGGEPLLNGLASNTDCPNPLIKQSYKLNDICSEYSCIKKAAETMKELCSSIT